MDIGETLLLSRETATFGLLLDALDGKDCIWHLSLFHHSYDKIIEKSVTNR
jgi:hypothetical protein